MTTMPDRDERVSWVMTATNHLELTQRYDTWAQDYDQDLVNFGYNIPSVAAGLMGRYCTPGRGPVLDAGCGTGLIGGVLTVLGYQPLVGIDLSPGMLRIAEQKGAYAQLRQMVLGEPLDFPADQFNAVVSMGVFVAGHAPAHAFDELVRVTQPGGHILFSIRPDLLEMGGFKEKSQELERAQRWNLAEVTQPFHALPFNTVEAQAHNVVFVYRVR